jgi:glycosyltransferase involved in cell wall biosynthesis
LRPPRFLATLGAHSNGTGPTAGGFLGVATFGDSRTTPRRILMVGASSTRICGVRDHARNLERALEELGQGVATLWWERNPGQGVTTALSEARAWASEIVRSVREWDPDCILWHYSVFTYGHRGVPLLVPLLARRLGAADMPLVAVLHEFAYSFGRRRWRGTVLALTQRAALFVLLRRCRALVVTTEERARWVLGHPWLPRRPIAFVPVCSNVPPRAGPRHRREGAALSVGVFGFGAEGFLADPVVSAVSRLRAGGLDISLVLLGSPGSESPQGRAWQAAARGAGCADALTFTGILDEEELANALSGLDVVVLPDEGGPTSRKTTLAAALAYGKPVVALDSPYRWEPLLLEQAVVLAPSTGEGLAQELEPLLEDRERRDQQGERAAAFYRRRMAPEVIAASILAFLDSVDSAVVGR